MEINNFLNIFFNKQFEKDINYKMLEYSYNFENELVLNYIKQITDISLEEFLCYINNNSVNYLEASDIIQFSSFDDLTTNICEKIKLAGDKGFSALEIGKILENDGKERKIGAYLKYGENHSKSSLQLGLLHSISNKYFLSCLGFVFSTLSEKVKKKLLCRLILRNKLIRKLISETNKNGHSSYYMEVKLILSEKTINRRKSNIKTLLKYLKNNEELNLDHLIENIEI